MSLIIGIIVVLSCVLGGYAVHGGKLSVLWVPSEFLIILGAALGACIISNPFSVLGAIGGKMKNLFKKKPYTKADYIELLCFLFSVFRLMKTKGMLVIESHIENPAGSDLFTKFPGILKDHHLLDFIGDTLRLLVMGVDNHYQMEDLIDKELEVHHQYSHAPLHALATVGEGLPAFGIVAAVLGVINTMRSINQPPAVLGGLIGGALVGTFLGILISYGLVSPMATYLNQFDEAEGKYLNCVKAGIISHMQGNAPAVTVEFVRKIISPGERPDFLEVENAINNLTK